VHLPLPDGDDAALALAAALGLELADVRLELVEMVHAVVGHADGAHLARLDGLDERPPRALAVLGPAVRRVDEHQVEVVEPRLGERRVHELVRVVVPERELAHRHLCGEEDVGASNA